MLVPHVGGQNPKFVCWITIVVTWLVESPPFLIVTKYQLSRIPHSKKHKKAFRIQISSNLDFGIKKSTIRGMILVGVKITPWISYPRPGGPSGPGKAAQLLWRTCRRVSWPWENPGSWGITSASWTRILRVWRVGDPEHSGKYGRNHMESLDVHWDLRRWWWLFQLVNAPELGNHWDDLFLLVAPKANRSSGMGNIWGTSCNCEFSIAVKGVAKRLIYLT